MSDAGEASLPPLYAAWVREAAGGRVPKETVATCDTCVMLPPAGHAPGPGFFVPGVKCCTYQPTIPNFLAGRILADPDPGLAPGREALEERIARRVGVAPRGVLPDATLRFLYANRSADVFGRAPALTCPYLVGDGACGVWRHRPGVCATWYCKHVRGETGSRFWKLADKLLRAVEGDLALWCAAEEGIAGADLERRDPDAADRPNAADLGGPVDPALHREVWGPWDGREKDFFLASAARVERLTWTDVLSLCGPVVRVLAGLLAQGRERLVSDAVPGRLRLAPLLSTRGAGGDVRVSSYSPYDPVTMPDALFDALRHFDGRPTREALDAIGSACNLTLAPTLLRKLVDFGILTASD